MSRQTPPLPNHRHTRSAIIPSPAAVSQNPQNPHHLNLQAHTRDSQFGMDQHPQPTTPPRTPQKTEYNSSIHHEPPISGQDSVSKSRSKGKNRPKHVLTSPAVSRNDRRTPPLIGMQSGGIPTSERPISTPSTTAYAGPTFHASPAPSALPIPSFYSKSVPDSPGIKDLPTRKDETPSSSRNDSPAPPAAPISAAQPHREESPLDFFFKADREEKARARSASSFYGSGSESGPFSPPSDSPKNSHSSLAPGSQGRNRGAHFSGGSTSALFAMELDGTSSDGKPYGPAFSTPYNERIKAAQSSATSLQSSSQTTREQQQSQDRSEALKAYLFSAKGQSSPVARPNESSGTISSSQLKSISDATPRNAPGASGGQRSAGLPARQGQNNFPPKKDSVISRHPPRGGSRSSGLRQEVTPTKTPAETSGRVDASYPTPLNSSRNSRIDSLSNTRNFGGNIDSNQSTTYNSSSPSGTPPGSRSTDLKGMEDSLRRILKLEPVGNSSVQSIGIGSMPAAAASVPNYVGGRPPPMNGMHSGVMGS